MTAGCTIVARNYLALARVVAHSFLEQHPHASFSVLMLDDVDGTVRDDDEPFTVVRPTDIIPAADFREMAVMYSVLELATALKPWFMSWVAARAAGPVVYLDPDIQVFAPMDEALDQAARHPIVLTPHTVQPIPRDRKSPDERFILKAGAYNLGFIMLSHGTDPFLAWWKERLRYDCIVAPQQQLFVDQRWMDLAPGYFDVGLVRHPGYNVAYWNLGPRTLAAAGGRTTVNGSPLVFFHFSGFDPSRPKVLSRHAGGRPRATPASDPVLARLCQDYGERLYAAGHRAVATLSYAHDTLPNGAPLEAAVRRHYRDAVIARNLGMGPPPPDPHVDPEEFLAWARRTAPPGDLGWRYVEQWSPQFPRELEHVLMAISRRPGARRVAGRLATIIWRTMGRRDLGHESGEPRTNG